MKKIILISVTLAFSLTCFAQKGINLSDTLTGTLNVLIIDDFENNISETTCQLICDDGKTYKLESFKNIRFFQSGDRIRITGNHLSSYKSNSTLKSSFIQESNIELIQKRNTSNLNNYGERKYAVILYNFIDDQSKFTTAAETKSMLFGESNSANAYIKAVSHGKAWLTGDIYDNNGEWYTIDREKPKNIGEITGITDSARVMADKDIDFRNYNGIIYICTSLNIYAGGFTTTHLVPTVTDEGILQMYYVFLNGFQMPLIEATPTHEIVHNYGVGHDGKRIYPEGDYNGNPLKVFQYGNTHSIMGGGGMGHMSLAMAKYIWPDEYNTEEIVNPGSYSFSLAALADINAAKMGYLQGIYIPRDSLSTWTIEYRDNVGVDSIFNHNNFVNYNNLNYGSGLVISLSETSSPYGSGDIYTYIPFLDDVANTYRFRQHEQNVIKVNEEFADPSLGLRVRPIDEDENGLIHIEVELRKDAPNIRINKRDLNWPDTVSYEQNVILNYSLFNNSNITINEPFQVTLYEKYDNGQWESVPGQSSLISNFQGRSIIDETFAWIPQKGGNYLLKIIADDLNQLNELSKFDNYTPSQEFVDNYIPSGEFGHQITVITDCNNIEVTENINICQGENYNGWTTSGQYLKTHTSSLGCDSTIITNLTVHDLPNTEFTFDSDTLTSINTYPTYQWYNQDGIIEGATSKKYVIEKSGTYYLEVTNENGCSAMSNGMVLIKTKINDIISSQFNFVVIPNPSDGKFRLRFEDGETGKYQVQIISENGQVILNKEVYVIQNIHVEEFSLSNLPKGNYLIKVFDGKKTGTKKVILK